MNRVRVFALSFIAVLGPGSSLRVDQISSKIQVMSCCLVLSTSRGVTVIYRKIRCTAIDMSSTVQFNTLVPTKYVATDGCWRGVLEGSSVAVLLSSTEIVSVSPSHRSYPFPFTSNSLRHNIISPSSFSQDTFFSPTLSSATHFSTTLHHVSYLICSLIYSFALHCTALFHLFSPPNISEIFYQFLSPNIQLNALYYQFLSHAEHTHQQRVWLRLSQHLSRDFYYRKNWTICKVHESHIRHTE